MRSARVASLALILALAACGGAKKSETNAPPPDEQSVGSPAPAPAAEPPGNTQAPRERFMICPGHPRCPKQ